MKRPDYICEVPSNCDDRTEDRSIYLTFDDGPNPYWTPQILNVLAEYRAPATFFVIGAYAKSHPELIRRIVAEGHEVANHTMTHPDLSTCGPLEVEREIIEANEAIIAACPQAAVRRIRAPYGVWSEEVLTTSAGAGLTAVHWSADPRDWSRPGANAIVDVVLASVRPGAIVLLHDGCPPDELGQCAVTSLRDQTLTALSRIIPALHERGFAIRPLPRITEQTRTHVSA
ncbi:beta-1,4-N-acetylglucosamine oligosaccharide deacetylase NodB [Rhizobium tibeticum]|uniref:Chitooligosaccharide deacetylase n=1 Tax=Rhizobium tibeticum TaxID=501024 RepID=A0A1H8WMI1_9HYPH|nr:chitooligosaccharide deacetylase NodB [Rhizobium tibeticum]SEI20632.1 putative polysaccharide deacetylase PdaA precursor [Rhizobium tibeticum]SEP28842.1 beta-1,4-N-acetylglucosamine oligosaccharide deacetylase NodB [Rhizobium tibeticum]